MTHVEIDGEPATVPTLLPATRSYGHFTSMQVRDRRVAGLDLHLDRLREASAELFPDAGPVPGERIVELIGRALRDVRDASVRVTVLPEIMVTVSEPVPDTPRAPLRVRTIAYERELPHLKHVATLGLTYHWQRARRDGFDDVLFAGHDGLLREGSVWNLALWDGSRVIWPDAPVLTGITMRVLRAGLAAIGVPDEPRELSRSSLAGFRAAAATNSQCPAQPIASVDDLAFPGGSELTDVLWRAWRAIPWTPLP